MDGLQLAHTAGLAHAIVRLRLLAAVTAEVLHGSHKLVARDGCQGSCGLFASLSTAAVEFLQVSFTLIVCGDRIVHLERSELISINS